METGMGMGPFKPEKKREDVSSELKGRITEFYINEDLPESEGGRRLSYKTFEEAEEAVKYFNTELGQELAFVGKDREGSEKPFKVMFDVLHLGAGFEKLNKGDVEESGDLGKRA